MIKLSIIVPVYNVEKYIERCLDSLLKQDLDNYEIIVVNDGSTDNSQDIIDKYQKKYGIIKSLKKANGGLSDARNYGLKHAKGKYVLFVDSDDYVKENMLKEIYDTIDDNKADIMVLDYTIAKEDNFIYKKVLNNKKTGFITCNEYFFGAVSAWNKVYKRSFLVKNKFSFPKGIIYEDLAVVLTLAKYNPKIYYLNKSFVYYFYSDVSITRGLVYKKSYEDIFKSVKILYDNLNNQGFDKELENIIVDHLLYMAGLNFYKFEKYDQIDKIASFIKKHYPKWQKNKYIKDKPFKEKVLMWLFYHRKYNFIKIVQKIKR